MIIEDFRKMKTGIDWYAFGGIMGTGTAVILQNFSTFAAGAAALSTCAYMIFRVAREWRMMKREVEANDGPFCQNYKPAKKSHSKKHSP